jgi:multicomponent Na+:H+ antiporter subunit B
VVLIAFEHIIFYALLTFMVVSALALVWFRNLFAVVMLSGSFSLTAAVLYVVMDAVDVAFTEAAVGAGIATVLMLGTLALTTDREKADPHISWPHFLIVLVTGAALIYGTLDMPHYGNANAPIHKHVAPEYLNESQGKTGVPNVVTSVLASYRGYDTLGEVTVIFTAAAGVLALIGRRRRSRKDRDDLPSRPGETT